MSAPGKTKIYVLKKPEGLPISVDKYKRPDIEKYEEMEFEKSKKDKLENKDEPKSDILKVQTSVPQPSKVSLFAIKFLNEGYSQLNIIYYL